MKLEVRKCDYCGRHGAQHALLPERLAEKGWTEDDEGRDKCPVCTFCQDTTPLAGEENHDAS